MRLLRVGPAGQEIPVALVDSHDSVAFDLRPLTADIDGAFLSRDWLRDVDDAIRAGTLASLDISAMRVGSPISRPQAIYGIGANYVDHATESALAVPSEPIVFSKAPNSLCGPTDAIRLPAGSQQGDWEGELGIVIGRTAYELDSVDSASAHIAGYVACNDVSERSWQLERGGQWLKGKSFPTSNPCGPWLASPDEIDAAALDIELRVNSIVRQRGNTSAMVFSAPFLVWYLSRFVQLEPGDLINSGTPAGVGLGMSPPLFLADGDVIELRIPGLGEHRSTVVVPGSR